MSLFEVDCGTGGRKVGVNEFCLQNNLKMIIKRKYEKNH
jgi:hypothetical protein